MRIRILNTALGSALQGLYLDPYGLISVPVLILRLGSVSGVSKRISCWYVGTSNQLKSFTERTGTGTLYCNLKRCFFSFAKTKVKKILL